MVEKVTINKVFRDPVTTKFGPGVRTSILTSEYPGTKMSSFARGTEAWKEGDTVEVDITKNGEYTNFKPVGAQNGPPALEGRVTRLEEHVFGKKDSEAVIQTEAQNDFDDFQ